MTVKRSIPLLVAAGLAMLPNLALAQGWWDGRYGDRRLEYGTDFRSYDAYGLEQRAYGQRQRIEHGIRTGQLTRNEARNLLRAQDRIWRDIQLAKADRFLSHREVDRITDALDDQDRRIFHESHDSGTRWPRERW